MTTCLGNIPCNIFLRNYLTRNPSKRMYKVDQENWGCFIWSESIVSFLEKIDNTANCEKNFILLVSYNGSIFSLISRQLRPHFKASYLHLGNKLKLKLVKNNSHLPDTNHMEQLWSLKIFCHHGTKCSARLSQRGRRRCLKLVWSPLYPNVFIHSGLEW